MSGVGTPLMPNRTFETYVFALFNEDLKPGPVSERNFGLFRADLTPVYDVGLLRTSQSEMPRMSVPLNPTEEMQWCVARADVGLNALQANIDYVCGLGFNCLPTGWGGVFLSKQRASPCGVRNERVLSIQWPESF
ncbi:Glucan endo-1,3-beta-glucosidase [Acorus calamus]|uniref:Glucan endo-1,3-beta-glucosidase n=1 Tax=Acorus calamus TaxID=4465 RepID=A0AAV9ENR1_ACOCL|nr:Glucan endo-1,3-beta-glucosidase [Acorus calamus]